MNTAVLEKSAHKKQWHMAPEKTSFEEAVAECNAVPVETFIDELKKRVKARYKNAKG
jgi:hypothetical protein